MTTAEAFKRFRRQFKLSQQKVADSIGIHQGSYAGYELDSNNPKSSNPTVANLIKLATIYNVSTDYLLGLSDNPRPYQSQSAAEESPVKESNIDSKSTTEILQARLDKLESALVAQGIKI